MKKKKRKKREEPLKLHKRARDPIRGSTPAADRIIKVMLKYAMVLRVFNNMSGLSVISIQDYSIPWRDTVGSFFKEYMTFGNVKFFVKARDITI